MCVISSPFQLLFRLLYLATTLHDIRLELAREDAAVAAGGVISPHKTTPTTFLTMGLDLEEQQCVTLFSADVNVTDISVRRLLQLEVSRMKGTQTSKQLADLEDKRTSLRNRIHRWREIQLVYMPCAGALLAQSIAATSTAAEPPTVEPAEEIHLFLPSALPERLRQCQEISTILDRERRLRVAQADDALADIRRQCRIISGLWQFKKFNINGTGNKACTRMRTLFNRFSLRTQRCTARYRAARAALLVIEPSGSWHSRLRELRDDDIRGPGKDDSGSQSRFEPSWIWLVPRVQSAPDMGDSEIILDDSLQVEWSKCRARKERWEEEVLIIQEEMRRVIMYQRWRAQWWRDQGKRRTDLDSTTLHGITGYAEKQANLCERLGHSCASHWLPGLQAKGIAPNWGVFASVSSGALHVLHTENSGDAYEDSKVDTDEEVDNEEEAEAIGDGIGGLNGVGEDEDIFEAGFLELED